MEIRLTKAMKVALQDFIVLEPFNLDLRHCHYQSVTSFDLRDFTKENIEALKAEVDKNLHVRGMKTLSTDIKMYLSVAFNIGEAKAIRMTSVKKAEIIFYSRFAPLERRHLYRRCADGGSEVRWLAYNLESISWHPKEKYSPEHLTFHLTYIKRGEERGLNFSLYPLDIIGNSPDYAIEAAGWKFENPVLRDNYLEETEIYESHVDAIGRQFYATGLASDDVNDDSSWRWRGDAMIVMDKDDEKAQVVIDVETESDKHRNKKAGSNKAKSSSYWKKANELLLKVNGKTDNIEDEDLAEENEENELEVEVPLHPYVTVFDLKRHSRFSIHIGNLTEYVYDANVRNKLVLPEEHTQVLECLMSQDKSQFSDVVKNKSGGTIILSQGPPGTGKTLTAEIYAEAMQKPLYTVQCSQLGLSLDSLEKNLTRVLSRGSRWNAVTLLDEADVYVYHRGNDLHQNAVVGVFLRILEYHTGVLFLTTNRGDLVDDAILSRCTVRIPYGVPTVANQKKIWKNISQANGVDLSEDQIDSIVQIHNDLSGRDIKNLLKLVLMVYRDPKMINCDTISKMRTFKPTTKVNE